MSSMYKKANGTYYLAVSFQNKRMIRSLATKSFQTARSLRPQMEKEILQEIINGNKTRNLPFPELVRLYLSADHNWKDSTLEINTRMLSNYMKRGLPDNATSKAMTIRAINACNNWGYKNGFIKRYNRINGGSKWNTRLRVINDEEMKKLFQGVTPAHFNRFVRFAYYTGARLSEIRNLTTDNIKGDYIEIEGKTGKRIIKLNSQAQEVLDGGDFWNYTLYYVELTWKRAINRLGLENIRFHDLRRTFGYNLIKQGMPIYQVSKLLGHSSVVTTEKHYAPLLCTDIDDFRL